MEFCLITRGLMHMSHREGPVMKIKLRKAENAAFAEFKYLEINQLYGTQVYQLLDCCAYCNPMCLSVTVWSVLMSQSNEDEHTKRPDVVQWDVRSHS